jgi:hypothetical protein
MSAATTFAPNVTLGPLCRGALEFLEHAYDDERALFSYSARFADGRFENDFDHRLAPRYTVNTLLGLRRVAPFAGDHPLCSETLVDRFLELQAPALSNAADLGLLLALLVEGPWEDDAVRVLGRVAEAARRSALDVQDVAWMLWGACAATRVGLVGAEALARELLSRLIGFAHPSTGLPRHDAAWHRRHVVSFGGLVYYLRALHEAAVALDDADAAARFRAGVGRALALQGRDGEWPWMIGVATGKPLDVYPIFTVHQDSMAMLFLLPARDQGIDVGSAIEDSLAWNTGRNQLGESLVVKHPFHVHRSIERVDAVPRVRRYVRTLGGRPAGLVPDARVRVNRECRSYHLGWVLFAWAGRDGAL